MRPPQTTATRLSSGGPSWHRPSPGDGEFDGWLGTPSFPGYRAGQIVARLSHLPHLAADQLYLDVLLLDSAGRTADAISGACASLPTNAPVETRSRFVCLAAELLRHTGNDETRFRTVAQAVSQLRELGVDRGPLMAAAKLLDMVCSEASVVASLADMLVLSLGEDDARSTVADIHERLVRTRVIAHEANAEGRAGLREELTLLVRALGKHRVRHVLRMSAMFDLVPQAEMYRL